MLRFAESSFDRLPRALTLKGRGGSAVFSRVALIAGRGEVRFAVYAAADERLDVIDDRAHVVEKRGGVASPVFVEVRQRGRVPGCLDKDLHKPESRAEYGGPVAPATEPAVPEKDANLHVERDLRPDTAYYRGLSDVILQNSGLGLDVF